MRAHDSVSPRRPRKRSEEGAVMLVVMLILLTATAMAAVSLQTTQYELRAAGYNRAALQTQYVSEAGASTSIAWFDAISLDGQLNRLFTESKKHPPPNMLKYGEPEVLPANRMNATRTEWAQEQETLATVVIPPITKPGSTQGTTDVVGTLGPRSNYVPGVDDKDHPGVTDYVVDFYDCLQLPNTNAAGSQVNLTGSAMREVQYYCVVTSRGRAFVPGAPTKTWTISAGNDYIVNRFTMGHDSRGTIVTPPVILPP